MKLGTLLLRDAVISLGQLEAALRNQVLCGGRLGTNLVELDFLDLDTLTHYLAVSLDVPPATQEMFEKAGRAAIESFDVELAERHAAFPLGHAPDGSGALLVAMADPGEDALHALGRAIGHSIQPCVAPELRIFYYLEKYYGVARKARYVREGSNEPAPDVAVERRRTHPARGIMTPPKVRFEPRAKLRSRPAEKLRQEALAADGTPGKKRAQTGRHAMSYLDACSAIDVAESREAIADVLLDYAHGRFEVFVVFLVRDANAIGWRLYTAYDLPSPSRGSDDDHGDSAGAGDSDSAAPATIERLGLPLGGASALQEAHDSAGPYRGGPTSVGRPIERTLWQFLQMEGEPTEMLVVPVLVKRRVVNLIYAHGLRHREIDDTAAKKLGELARRASRTYARLIQASKGTPED